MRVFVIFCLLLIGCDSDAQITKSLLLPNNPPTPQTADFFSKIDDYRSVDLGVYVQHLNDAGSITDRIWIPFDKRYAQFYQFSKELSDEYIQPQISGIAEYFRIQNPTSTTGTFVNLNSDGGIAYTSQVGATMTVTFVGEEISFRYWTGSTGGLWHFVVDGGASVDISCWHAVGEVRRTTLFTNLAPGSHTIVGTFMGDDPAHDVVTPLGTLYASNQDGSTGNGYNVERKTFYIVGSNQPNYCYERNATISSERAKTYTMALGHWELSTRLKDLADPNPGDGEVIPRHGGGVGDPGSVTFANVATDRTLKIDGGSNLFLDVTTGFNLGQHGDRVVLKQVFKGHSWNRSPTVELADFDLEMVFTSEGLDFTVTTTLITDVVMGINYGPMMGPNVGANILLYNGDEEFSMTPANVDEEITDVFTWDGTLATVSNSGTTLEKSLVSGYRLYNPFDAMELSVDIGQELFANDITGSGNKIYTLLATPQINAYNGDSWTLRAKYNYGFIPEAYEYLKEDNIFSNISTGQTGNVISVTFDVDRPEEPAPPTVERVTVSGTEIDGGTLTASYSGYYSASQYADASTWTWYRSDNDQSVGSVIPGATSSTYNEVQADVAKVIRAVLTPTDEIGTVGDPVTSIYTGVIQDDEFNPFTDITWHNAHGPDEATDLSGSGWINRGSGTASIRRGSDPIPTFTGGGVDFEASNNEELTLDQPSTQYTMPVEIWIKAELESYNGSFGRFLSWTSSQVIEQRGSGRIYLSGGDTGYNMPLSTAVWMRFVISGTSNTSKFNVNNGTELTTIAASTSAFGTSDGSVGANSGGTGNRLDGKIYYFFVRQGELSTPQVADMWTWTSTH